METEERDLSGILRRVQQYLNIAEAPNHAVPDSPEWHATDTEQKLARERADALMLQYAITEAMAEASKPYHERIKPISELFDSGTGDLASKIDSLAEILARFTRTRIRRYAQQDRERRVWMDKVYGYESDVRYFLFLYTTLRLHLIGALRPELDKSLSLEENCYNLHSAGFGWREIAKMYGWTTRWEYYGEFLPNYLSEREIKQMYSGAKEIYFNPEGVRWEGESRIAVRPFRSAYFRECKKRGEEPVMNISPEAFRIAAADGYMRRIRERLAEVEAKRKLEGGNALALRIDDLDQFIREESGTATKCPACGKWSLFDYQCDLCGNKEGMPGKPPEPYEECQKCKRAKSGVCRDHSFSMGRVRYLKHSEAGYSAGVSRANSADLGGQRTGSSVKREIH